MIVRGTWDWNLIKIETDSGVYGIGEANWGWGLKDLVVNKMKGILVGEDPLNVDRFYTKMLRENPETMAYVRQHSPVPVCTGENLYGFSGFQRLIELQGCDGVHVDIPKAGGLVESKRISEFAASYAIWTAAYNPANPMGTIASAHAASAMRNFRIHELAKWIDRWPKLVIHEG